MGKTHSKPLAVQHGRGTAWARHVMCESAFRESFSRSVRKSPKGCFGYVLVQAAPMGLGKTIFKVTFLQHYKEPMRSKLKIEIL
jgi:hypothetical protein